MVLLYPDQPLQKQRYVESVYSILAKKYFTGALAGLEESQQRSLLAFAHVTANGTTLGSEIYKDKTYLVVDLGSDSVQYNDLKFTPASLVAHVVNEKLLTIMKAFAKPVEGAAAVHGLKLSFKIPHRDFLRETTPNESTLIIYAPSVAIGSLSGRVRVHMLTVSGPVRGSRYAYTRYRSPTVTRRAQSLGVFSTVIFPGLTPTNARSTSN